MNESLTLAKYVTDMHYNDLPPNAIDKAKMSFLDQLGVILAASGLSEECKPFIDIAVKSGGRKESKVIGSGARVPAYMAAFANASMAHALDYEDVHDEGDVHPNAPLVPAALALAEYLGNVSGKEFITSLALGTDIACRLGLAKDHAVDAQKAGWYLAPIFGAFGATTASCKLLGLTAEQIVDAYSLTLCQATCSSELTNSSQTVIRSIRDSFVSKAGVLSSLLAWQGVKGFSYPFEGEFGFYRMYSEGKYNSGILVKNLGKIFEGANVSYKAWPACRGTHAYIQAALQIWDELNGNLNDIKEIIVSVGNEPISKMLWHPIESKRNPSLAIDAKFSIPFTMATALVYKKVTLDHFTPKLLQDQQILKIANKITCIIDPKWNRKIYQGLIKVKYNNKEIESKSAEYIYGHPNNPMPENELVAKFIDCAKHAARPLPDKNLKKLTELILHMEDAKNVNEIIALL